jgi:hypothetical protein
MKNLPTYNEWINEGLATGFIGDRIQFNGKDVEVIKIDKMEDRTVLVVKSDSGEIWRVRYDDGQDAYVLDEFEGSLGPTTMPLSTMLLATQPGSPTIAF